MIKPGIPQGTRDFSPIVVRRRQFILNTIREVFELSGYEPLETPAMELLETLTGKYGDEGDKLIFKILNNGLNDPANIEKTKAGFAKILEGKNDTNISSRALRYDLTIPFARFIAMNRGNLTLPFKRYQMQPVWRADRPQKGRYREFTQCDCDVVGSNALWNEAELVHIYRNAFQKLGINDIKILLNNRKILSGLAEICEATKQLTDITIAIDKLEKIGTEKVVEELKAKQLDDAQINKILNYLNLKGTNNEKLEALRIMFAKSETGLKGIEELEFVLTHSGHSHVFVDLTLARGLDYYTGIIYEVKAPEHVKMGSIGGGGRYDNLTGLFGVDGISGVGISFGVDRIYDVMETLNLFPDTLNSSLKVLFLNMGEKESAVAASLMYELQRNNISCMLYPDSIKMDKQFKYAERKNIPIVIIPGSRELAENNVVIKILENGKQSTVPFKDLISHIQNI